MIFRRSLNFLCAEVNYCRRGIPLSFSYSNKSLKLKRDKALHQSGCSTFCLCHLTFAFRFQPSLLITYNLPLITSSVDCRLSTVDCSLPHLLTCQTFVVTLPAMSSTVTFNSCGPGVKYWSNW